MSFAAILLVASRHGTKKEEAPNGGGLGVVGREQNKTSLRPFWPRRIFMTVSKIMNKYKHFKHSILEMENITI